MPSLRGILLLASRIDIFPVLFGLWFEEASPPLRAIAYPRSLSTAPGLLHTLLMIFESPAPRKEPLALAVFS